MNPVIDNKEIAISGRILRTAKLRHEMCDFLEDPPATIRKLRDGPRVADLFTFVPEIYSNHPVYPFHKEAIGLSVLTITGYKTWWERLDFRVRNKIRKAQKTGVELRMVQLTDDFAQGVERIYNESPVRQGKKFWHFGKNASAIKEELSSFLDRSFLVGAFYKGGLIGFMKLFHGENVLRTVHIIAKLKHRDKPVMDALIAKAVELCEQNRVGHLQYGSWAEGGVGAFRVKHGFERVDVPRYFAPLGSRGELMLKLNLHRPIREHVPEGWRVLLRGLRGRWTSFRYRSDKRVANVKGEPAL
jgi:hypothetical protein